MVHMGCGEKQKTVAVGPFGGPGGSKFDDGIYDGVREITLTWGECIDSIQVVYEKDCKPIVGPKHGGNGGNNSVTIKLQPDESLTVVTGHYSPLVDNVGNPFVRSLTFITNLKTYGPYGVQHGTPFSVGGKFVGFFGRSGWYLDAIGFNLETC